MFEQNVTSPFITNPHVQSHEKPQPLRDAVKKAVHHYLKHLNGQDVQDVYDLVLSELKRHYLKK